MTREHIDNRKPMDKRLEELLLEGIPSGRMPSLTDYVKAVGIAALPYSGDRALLGMINSPVMNLPYGKKALFNAAAANLILAKYSFYTLLTYVLWT